jgi:hypothetical protein
MTRPLTGDKFEIAVLNAELRGFSELIDTWKEEAERCARAIERVRELHKPFGPNNEWCDHCEIGQNSGYEWADYPCATIRALDGEQ